MVNFTEHDKKVLLACLATELNNHPSGSENFEIISAVIQKVGTL